MNSPYLHSFKPVVLRILSNKYLILASLAGMMLLPVLLLFSLQAGQHILKATVLERLEGEQQVTITMDASAVQWERKNKELKIDGRYFDVQQVTKMGNKLLLTGHYDDAETAVWQLIQGTLAHTKQGSLFHRLLLLLQCFVLLELGGFSWLRRFREIPWCAAARACYTDPLQPVTGPPPRK